MRVEPLKEDFAAEVFVIVASVCSDIREKHAMRRAQDLLEIKGVPYEVVDLSNGEALEMELGPEMRDAVGRAVEARKANNLALPLVFVDGTCLGNDLDLQELEDDGLLTGMVAHQLVPPACPWGENIQDLEDEPDVESTGDTVTPPSSPSGTGTAEPSTFRDRESSSWRHFSRDDLVADEGEVTACVNERAFALPPRSGSFGRYPLECEMPTEAMDRDAGCHRTSDGAGTPGRLREFQTLVTMIQQRRRTRRATLSAQLPQPSPSGRRSSAVMHFLSLLTGGCMAVSTFPCSPCDGDGAGPCGGNAFRTTVVDACGDR